MTENSRAEMPEDTLLEGFFSVRAVLMARSRPVHSIVIRTEKVDSALRWVEAEARRQGIPCQHASSTEIDAQAQGRTHGGLIARVGPRHFLALDEMADLALKPALVMLDGIEDPFNFGQAVRSLYIAGITGLIVRPRNWMSADGTVARASAGATEMMPTAIAETSAEAAEYFRDQGLTIACATEDPSATTIYEANLTVPLFVLIGGEKRGVTRSFSAHADLPLHIPLGRPDAPALGTAAAASVLAFEILRQRRSP
jgi:23S rRNA (guanosine2251-2'-O)-methyltransferase